MARVAVTFRVMPADRDTDLPALKGRIREAFTDRVRDIQERPLAFGLVGLEIALVLEDAAGEVDRSETALAGLEGVSSVETLSVDLV